MCLWPRNKEQDTFFFFLAGGGGWKKLCTNSIYSRILDVHAIFSWCQSSCIISMYKFHNHERKMKWYKVNDPNIPYAQSINNFSHATITSNWMLLQPNTSGFSFAKCIILCLKGRIESLSSTNTNGILFYLLCVWITKPTSCSGWKENNLFSFKPLNQRTITSIAHLKVLFRKNSLKS